MGDSKIQLRHILRISQKFARFCVAHCLVVGGGYRAISAANPTLTLPWSIDLFVQPAQRPIPY